MRTSEKNYFKFTAALVLGLLFRLIPLRAPNVEPIMATVMPMAKAYGAAAGFSFAVLSVLLYDLLTRTVGMHTLFVAGAYGFVGLASFYYFQKSKADKWGYVRFAVLGTLFFDALTGLTVGPIFFHESFGVALVGQIPFTALHLFGNTVFAYLLSPHIYSLLIKKKERKKVVLLNQTCPVINSPNGI